MLLKDGADQHSVSSQAAYAVLVELCRQSNTAASGLQALAHGPNGAEQNLVPRMQASPHYYSLKWCMSLPSAYRPRDYPGNLKCE